MTSGHPGVAPMRISFMPLPQAGQYAPGGLEVLFVMAGSTGSTPRAEFGDSSVTVHCHNSANFCKRRGANVSVPTQGASAAFSREIE
jgi:hypothetical protein